MCCVDRLNWRCIELCLRVYRYVSAFGKILPQQPVGVLVGAALPGMSGSQKQTLRSVARVKRWWSGSSCPLSHVSDLYNSLGSFFACLISAEMTLSVEAGRSRMDTAFVICPRLSFFWLACRERRIARWDLRCSCSSFLSTPRVCINKLR